MSGRKRIYEWMLHYRNVAERRRFRIVRWKLTDEQARQFSQECAAGNAVIAKENLYQLRRGCKILDIPAVIV